MGNEVVKVVFCDQGNSLKLLLTRRSSSGQDACFFLPKKLDSESEFQYVKDNDIDDKKEDGCDLCWMPILELKRLGSNHGAKVCQGLGMFWKGMRSGHTDFSSVRLPDLILKNKGLFSGEIVFFGGSFNPWHQGHRACLDLCPDKNIVVVPDHNHWKTGPDDRCYWEYFLDICFKLKDTPFSVYSGFCGMKKPNPTVNWLPHVSSPQKSLLVGDDGFINIHKWNDFEKIVSELSSIYVVPRNYDKFDIEKQILKIIEIKSDLKITILDGHSFQHLSSSIIRSTVS